MKKTMKLLLAMLVSSGAFSQDEKSYQKLMELPISKKIQENGDVFLQGNFTEILTGKKELKDLQPETVEMLRIANAPHPDVNTIKKYIKEASIEFGVPFQILDAIAKTYNNYSMIGPSQYGAYGIMGLIENEQNNTLGEASKLIKTDVKNVKFIPSQNIRAAAALLSLYGKENKNSTNLMDWFNAVKQLTGLNEEETREMQAIDYYNVMNEGRSTITLWKENGTIAPQNNNEISDFVAKYYERIEKIGLFPSKTNKGATTGTVDYPGAIGAFTDCNYSGRGGRDIDTWVNHYIAEGTVAGAISWFRTCRGTNGSSAHFIVAVDGKVYQVVPVASKSWHAGASGQPNNERSIGTEHDVTKTAPSNWNNTTMLKSSTNLARYFCNKYAIPKARSLPGIRGHKELPGTSTDCPANIPWATWMNLLNSGGTSTNNVPTPTTPAAGASVAAPLALKWSNPVSGGSYRLQISKVNTGWTAANGFTTATGFTANVPINYSAPGLLTYTWPNADTAAANRPVVGNTYYWTVRSFSDATGVSSYSPVRSFKVTSSSARLAVDNSNVLVYPNPSNGELSINFDSNADATELNIYDLSGNTVFSKKYQISKGNNTIKENINGLTSGTYILFLNDGDKISTQNLIIQNK